MRRMTSGSIGGSRWILTGSVILLSRIVLLTTVRALSGLGKRRSDTFEAPPGVPAVCRRARTAALVGPCGQRGAPRFTSSSGGAPVSNRPRGQERADQARLERDAIPQRPRCRTPRRLHDPAHDGHGFAECSRQAEGMILALACISTYATAMPCRAVATPSSTELTHAPTTGMTSRLSEKTGSAMATT